jgi:hypothetical protein
VKRAISGDQKAWLGIAAVLFLVVCASTSVAGAIIPDNRTAPWQGNVGAPGGIPNRTKIYKNIVTDLGADPTGAKDCSAIIQRAINNCPKGQVVYIPAGRFLIANQITIGNDKINRTLRGAGIGQTTLIPGNGGNAMLVIGGATWPQPSTWIPISSGATKGSTTITVADASPFVVGAPLSIGPSPLPSWAHNLGGTPDTSPTLRVMSKILSKTGTTITLDHPCPFDFSGMNPQALVDPTVMLVGFGIEDLSFDLSVGSSWVPIWFQQAWGCWVKNVEVKAAPSRAMLFGVVIRCEVRGCYTHDARSGPNHEGIIIGPGSWNLIEDNICNNGGAPPIILQDGINPASCNVIGYNYVINTAPAFWDISFSHGSGSLLNLAEGNVIKEYEDDGYFGSSSYGTLFRNCVRGQLKLKHFSNYYNIVGNVLGDTWANTYEAPELADYWSHGINPIYELGFPNIGNVSFTGTFGPTDPPNYNRLPNTLDGTQQYDRNVKATIFRHGNWDAVNKHVVWDPLISEHAIPDSLYYSSKAAWWPATIAWPPIGPDRDPMVSQIPAQIRFVEKGGLQPAATPPPRGATSTSDEPIPPRASQKGWKRPGSSPIGRRL